MRFREFREIREVKNERLYNSQPTSNIDFDPDKRVVSHTQQKRSSDHQEYNNRYDPDKRIVVSE